MTSRPRPAALWTLLSRTLRPSYGARCNAAEGVAAVLRDSGDRAQALAASLRPNTGPGPATPRVPHQPWRNGAVQVWR